MVKETEHGLMKKILSSKFRELQSFTDNETGISYQTMRMDTWKYLVNKYNINSEEENGKSRKK